MDRMLLVVFLFGLSIQTGAGIRKSLFLDHDIPGNPRGAYGDDPGEPLFLSPLIKAGALDKAKTLSRTGPLGLDVESYSGYLTVNDEYNSNMFFWFFPAQNGDKKAPVLLWLQGGPGGTSMFGIFNEHGPFYVTKDMKLSPREYAWTKKYNVVYIDNPVGTGWSFTTQDAGYAKNEDDVARDLYSALSQFFTLFAEYQPNDFYATGESYAGKYVPAISLKIHEENQKSPAVTINLKGLIIGDGLCDPESMFPQYAPFLYSIGLLDENQRDYFAASSATAVENIKNGQFYDAFKIFDSLLNGDLTGHPAWFYNQTGLNNYYNYLLPQPPAEFDYMNKFLPQNSVRKSIHVGNLTFNGGDKVEKMIVNDVMDTIKPRLVTILNADYKVLMYSGMLDIIVALPLTEAFLQTLEWKGLDGYKQAKRSIWKLNETDVDIAGYVRIYKNLVQVGVRGGGHILPFDQPARAFQMMDTFISNFHPTN